MKATTTTQKIACAVLLLVGLFFTNGVWSKDCLERVEPTNAIQSSAAKAHAKQVAFEIRTTVLTDAELYDLLHNPDLNKLDGLGDYTEDLHAAYR